MEERTEKNFIPSVEEISKAVEELKEEALKILSDLVSFDSKLGNEEQIQNYVLNLFVSMGLKSHSWKMDLEEIKDLPGFSPVSWSYEKKEIVVGTFFPRGSDKGKTLILNGHGKNQFFLKGNLIMFTHFLFCNISGRRSRGRKGYVEQ